MFAVPAEDAGSIAEFLRKAVAKATEKRNWNILRSDGTSFLEAWEVVETTAQETGSYYSMLFIEEQLYTLISLHVYLLSATGRIFFTSLTFLFCLIIESTVASTN